MDDSGYWKTIALELKAKVEEMTQENARLTADLELERGEHVSDRNRFQNVLVNLHAIARDEDCDPRSSIGMATSAVRQLRKDRDAAIAARDEAIASAERAETERAEARRRTDEYIRLNAALGERIERMEAWIKKQGHGNHACFELVDGQVVRHRTGRCECGFDAALAPSRDGKEGA